VSLTILGPGIWVKVLGHAAPIFPYDPPAIVTIPLAFLAATAVSLATRDRAVVAPNAARA
jgi:cation/acetate symporter